MPTGGKVDTTGSSEVRRRMGGTELIALSIVLGALAVLLAAALMHATHVARREIDALADERQRERALSISLVECADDGVIVTDVIGNIERLNARARTILGDHAEGATGRNAVELLREIEPVPVSVIRDCFRRIVELGESVKSEVPVTLGPTRRLALSLTPARGPDGKTEGIVCVFSDKTREAAIEQTKHGLTAMVTREIRKPLESVRGLSQMLLKGKLDEDDSMACLESVHRQTNHVVNLVSDFVDVARIETGSHAIRLRPARLDRLIESAVADLKPLADEKKISLRYASPEPAVPPVLVDGNLIEQVLINLISNALKYSPEGSWAEVVLSRRNEALAVSVRDGGLGIPRESMPRLFEKFYRVPGGERAAIMGTGLGLSLVKQVIEIHGGAITVESDPGRGSDFTFTVPIPPKERSSRSRAPELVLN